MTSKHEVSKEEISEQTVSKEEGGVFMLREQDKHFLMSLYSAVTLIFLWKGVWEGIYMLPLIEAIDERSASFVFLFVGLTMLTFSGLIFKEFDPLGSFQKSLEKKLHQIHHHHHRKEFQVVYYDQAKKSELTIDAKNILGIEKNALVVHDAVHRQESFIPMGRVVKVLYQGKLYWRA